jgi:hypothetical protein
MNVRSIFAVVPRHHDDRGGASAEVLSTVAPAIQVGCPSLGLNRTAVELNSLDEEEVVEVTCPIRAIGGKTRA